MTEMQTVTQLLFYAADHYGEKDFCRFIRNATVCSKSYTAFENDVLAVCKYIRHLHSGKKHIAFIGKTSYEYIACLTGMIVSGNVVVPFAPDISEEEAAKLFADADIEMLFCEDGFLEKAEAIRKSYDGLRSVVSLGDADWFGSVFRSYAMNAEEKEQCLQNAKPSDCALIIYTSGTTGDRKGVMLSHENLAKNSTYDIYKMEKNDVSFSILPMHHVFCYACDVLKTLYDGGTLCLNENLAELYTNILIFQPTIMRIVPAICKSMLTKIRIACQRNPQLSKREAAETVVGRNFRRMIAGSAFLSASVIDAFAEYGITARQGYGMTECSPRITTSDFSENHKYSNGILLGVDAVRAVDGEIQVKGPSVMLGYYKRPEETAKAFTEDGYLHTGDLGYLDGEYVYLVGRKKNLIILSNGENISPEEIENCFADEELVQEIVVVAEQDKITAQIYPNALLAHGLDEQNLRERIEALIDSVNLRMPSDRHIKKFCLRDRPFERTSTGKIKRNAFYYQGEIR